MPVCGIPGRQRRKSPGYYVFHKIQPLLIKLHMQFQHLMIAVIHLFQRQSKVFNRIPDSVHGFIIVIRCTQPASCSSAAAGFIMADSGNQKPFLFRGFLKRRLRNTRVAE